VLVPRDAGWLARTGSERLFLNAGPWSPAIVVVRPWRTCTSPSSVSARNACRTLPGFSPWSLARSGTDGSVSPEASCPERIAARRGSAACSHSSRGSAGSGPEVRDVAVLREWLAGAREVAASHQPGVQRVQQRAADLADLRGPEGGFDGPADVPRLLSRVETSHPAVDTYCRWGGWGSNPRPADHERHGPALRVRYLHGYHGAMPPMALIALFAQMARSTNRSTLYHGDHRMPATERYRRPADQRVPAPGGIRPP
jgi:hypothetical protein